MTLENQAVADGRGKSRKVLKDSRQGRAAATRADDGLGQATAVELEIGGGSECTGQELEAG